MNFRPASSCFGGWAARAMVLAVAAAGLLGVGRPALAQGASESVVKVRAVPLRSSVIPGDSLPLAVVLEIERPWHIWTSEEQTKSLPEGMSTFESAIFTELAATATPATAIAVHTNRIQWPAVHGVKGDLGDGPTTFAVYSDTAIAYVPLTVAPDAAPGTVNLKLQVTLQACDDNGCLMPATIPVSVELAVAPGVVGQPNDPALFAEFEMARLASLGGAPPRILKFPFFDWEFSLDQNGAAFFPLLLLLTFMGGALLNFTPCVLPIIPLKIMGLSAAAAGERAKTFKLGLAMSAGVVAFWLALGVLISSVKLIESTNQLFQYPEFTMAVGLFIAVMAVSMGGFFSVGLPQWVYAIEPKHETYGGSVIFGVMTAVLSTPCTAPLMGTAASWAVTTDSTATVLTVFFCIGLGMAAPYLVLSAYPQLARKMPKSGPASDVMKQVMGLLLLAAGAYFIGSGINGKLDEPSKFYWWVVAALGVCAGAWLAIRTFQLATTARVRAIFGAMGVGIAVIGGYTGWTMTYEVLRWSKFTPAAMGSELKAGKVVVVDFTADWCLICKFLEKSTLEPEAVSRVLNQSSVALLKADYTKGTNPAAHELQAKYGHTGIPFLLVFAPNGDNVLASPAYTQQQVLDAVSAARSAATTVERAARPRELAPGGE